MSSDEYEMVSGVLTRWDLPEGEKIPAVGDRFVVREEDVEMDTEGTERRTIKRIERH